MLLLVTSLTVGSVVFLVLLFTGRLLVDSGRYAAACLTTAVALVISQSSWPASESGTWTCRRT